MERETWRDVLQAFFQENEALLQRLTFSDLRGMPRSKALSRLGEGEISYKFFKTSWLDTDQVRVSQVSQTEFRVKCGKQLTDREIRGAIVKYMLNQQRRLSE